MFDDEKSVDKILETVVTQLLLQGSDQFVGHRRNVDNPLLDKRDQGVLEVGGCAHDGCSVAEQLANATLTKSEMSRVNGLLCLVVHRLQ